MAHSHRLSYRKLFALVIITLAVIGISRLFPISISTVEYIFSYVSYPLLRAQKVIVDEVNSYSEYQRDMTNLRQLVSNLSQTCESLQAENIQLQAIAKYAD